MFRRLAKWKERDSAPQPWLAEKAIGRGVDAKRRAKLSIGCFERRGRRPSEREAIECLGARARRRKAATRRRRRRSMRFGREANPALASPRDLAELSLRLDRLASDRREILADVASYAIEHPYEIAFGAAPRIASWCAASPTSVGRLAHSLGFKGFRDMRGFFRRHVRDSRCWEDDRPWTCASSKPTKVIQGKPSIGDDGLSPTIPSPSRAEHDPAFHAFRLRRDALAR